jgi:hypothetical protein
MIVRHFLFIFAVLTGISPVALADQSQTKPFAVVELFSSEGCSSCPAADLLVSKLTAWARQNNESVYPLIFHVDYWNNLGWRDVFSHEEYTQRQKEYARIFKDQGVYTPQMIVNGSDAFVGSNQEQLQKDLDRELTLPASVILHTSLQKKNDKITVWYKSEGYSDGDVINIALVERGLSTEVTAGENAGRTLHHDNVVKEFMTIPLTKTPSKAVIPLTRISDTSQASVIVYVQDPQTMLIETAKQLDLENE